jgi:hypothetical protein
MAFPLRETHNPKKPVQETRNTHQPNLHENLANRKFMHAGRNVTKVILVTLVVRGLDEKTRRSIRAEAVKRGLRLAQAVKEAFQLWRAYDQEVSTLSERDANNAAYNALRQELEKYNNKTILIAKGKFLGAYDDPRTAAMDLKRKAPDANHAIITVMGRDKREELEWLGGSLNL